MSRFFPRVWLLLVFLTLSGAAVAQLLPTQLTQPTTTTPATVQDPLGRETPSGTVFGFLQATQARNYTMAAQYLQMSVARRQTQGEELSTKLKVVMDRAFSGNLRRISTLSEGTAQEGVPLDRQFIGLLSVGEIDDDLVLVRVTDPGGARVWLISAETLAKIPDLYDQLQVHQVESRLPGWLQPQLLGMATWQWLALLIGIPISTGVGWLVAMALGLLRHLSKSKSPPSRIGAWPGFIRPLWLVSATVVHQVLVRYLSIPLLARHYYFMVSGVLLILGFSWLIWRVLRYLARQLRKRAILDGRMGTGSLMLLGERILKAIIFLIAVFVVLSSLGFNMTTLLAGLGIGGVAVAFAAQKTLENLFGGISVLGDEVIHVGDFCRFGDRQGWVEDISLRSTRIRTPERTELSIPNGSLATMNVENLSRRDKMLFNTKLGLRCETSADQMRYVLARIRRLLYEHPKVETDGARIRFISFDESALALEVNSYILTRDNAEFLAIKEDILLNIMDILAASGTSLALPSRTLYLGRDSGLDPAKSAAIAREVEQWRENRKLPFPDFAMTEISEISNSLPYPQQESAVRSQE